MNAKKIVSSITLAISLTAGMSVLPMNFNMMVNQAEARSDHYVCYDSGRNADLYIDVDSVKRYGYHGNRRSSSAHVYWSNGQSAYWTSTYDTATGTYYFSGGAGHPMPVEVGGTLYYFAVACDQFAY